MSQTAILVWLSAASVLPTFRADLAGYAQSRLLQLEAPPEGAPSFHGGAYAPDVVAEVEAALEEARSATASLEPRRALSALERAEPRLRQHPELPQAAWLMAERLELAADVEDAAPDGASSALALRQRAACLEGPRAAPYSDHAGSLSVPPTDAHSLSIDGLEPRDSLEWDDVTTTASLVTCKGEHHVRVVRGARLVWAGWVSVGASDVRVRLPVPENPPCSTDDLAPAHFEGGRAVPAEFARCDEYVLARTHAGGGIEVALCGHNACGPVMALPPRSVLTAVATKTPPTVAAHDWPVWASYTLVATAGVIATGLVLWRTGVFDRKEPVTTTQLTYMGQVKPMGFRF